MSNVPEMIRTNGMNSAASYNLHSMEDYQLEDWFSLYQSALVELEEAKMSGRIEAAQTAILARIEKLATLPGLHPEERQAIEDALRGLRSLEQEHARDGRRQTPCSEEVPPKTLTGKEHYAGKT
jgi:hypothetical protein